jgi:hypothetical protein
MHFLFTPSSYASLLSRYNKLRDKGKDRKAWELCMVYSKKRTLERLPWMFDRECAAVDLLAAHAALKAEAWERAFFNAKTAFLMFSLFNEPCAEIQKGQFSGTFADEMYETEHIVNEAMSHFTKGEIIDVQNEWEKIKKDYDGFCNEADFHRTLEQVWKSLSSIEKSNMMRRMEEQWKTKDLYGRWRTPDD